MNLPMKWTHTQRQTCGLGGRGQRVGWGKDGWEFGIGDRNHYM